MNLKSTAVLIAACLFATTAFSGEQMHHKIKVVVVEADGDGKTRIELDSEDFGFDLHNMEVGENQSITDKDGRSILVTRVAEGYTFEVDGKTIKMPAFDELGGAGVWINKCDHMSEDIDVHMMHDGMFSKSGEMDGVMVFSGKEIDAATQQVIRTALESAGHSDVSFAGGSNDGPHQVHVIKKIIHNTE